MPPHPQGPERERHWHDRVLKAKQPKDEVLHDGVNMVEHMNKLSFENSTLTATDPKILHGRESVRLWLRRFINQTALLCFSAPTGAGVADQDCDSAGHVFGIFVAGDAGGGALIFDAHGHYSDPEIAEPDQGMLVAHFADMSPEVLTEFIFETVLRTSRCGAALMTAVALMKRKQPLGDNHDPHGRLFLLNKCASLDEQVKQLRSSYEELAKRMNVIDSTTACMETRPNKRHKTSSGRWRPPTFGGYADWRKKFATTEDYKRIVEKHKKLGRKTLPAIAKECSSIWKSISADQKRALNAATDETLNGLYSLLVTDSS